jgi:hypothetical protein
MLGAQTWELFQESALECSTSGSCVQWYKSVDVAWPRDSSFRAAELPALLRM